LGDGHDAGWGGADNDIILAGTGNDFLFGGAGDDWIYGGSGEDLLNAGPGVDGILTEAGNDTIVFDVQTSGLDVISDGSFGPGDGDKIEIHNGGEVSDFNAVISHAYQDGPYVVIAFNATTGIYINGYSIARLRLGQFAFPRNALMLFVCTFDVIFELAPIVRELFGYLVDPAWRIATD
jgi:Ca2+-binding RTX toxin-like protein